MFVVLILINSCINILMSPHVYFESARPHKSLWALSTLERAISRVPPQVIRQMSLRRECFLAACNAAYERFFSRVDSQMSLQITFFCKGFSARRDRTLKRFFTSL